MFQIIASFQIFTKNLNKVIGIKLKEKNKQKQKQKQQKQKQEKKEKKKEKKRTISFPEIFIKQMQS